MRERLPVTARIAAVAIALTVSTAACTVGQPTDAGYAATAPAYRSELGAGPSNSRPAWMKLPPEGVRAGRKRRRQG